MGKKLDALLGRTFKAAKFKPTVNLAISRLTILKNQHQAHLRHAHADVLQLLQIGHNERALLRMIQKLSIRMPSLDSRMKALKEIASEISIVLQLDEYSSVPVEEQFNIQKQTQHEPEMKEENLDILPNTRKGGELSNSDARQKYNNVADAAQAAFESAAYAAAAARAAVELSRPESHDPDDHNSPRARPRKVLDRHGSLTSQLEDKELRETEGKEINKNIDELQKPIHIRF